MDQPAQTVDLSLADYTILVVDDDRACALALEDMLGEVGADVHTAYDGVEALEYLDLVRPSAVVADVQMPRMGGLDLLRQIRGRPGLGHLPVIMVTAHSDPQKVRIEALEAGVDDFLSKPVDPVELRLRLRNQLTLSSYRRALEIEKRSLELEVAAQTSQVRQQALLVQHAADAIVSTGADLRVESWNGGAEATFGVRAYAAIGHRIFDLFTTRWEEASQEAMLEALAARGRWTGELSIAARGGRTVRVRASVTRIDAKHGALEGYAFVMHDLTDMYQARAMMAQAEARSAQVQRLESLGAVTGNLAHDFNNWLGVILSYTALAREGVDRPDDVKRDLKVVIEAAESASAVVRQLLAFGRKQHLAPEVADLEELVRRLMRLLERLLGPDVRLELDLSDEAPAVRVDVGQLEQVMMNLVVNARDAMPHGGRLTVSLTGEVLEGEAARVKDLEPGAYARLSVEDTGTGMDEATRLRIFEPLFTTKGPERGSGLGLSCVYGIVRQSRGQIEVATRLGHGTRFDIWLPADPTEARADTGGFDAVAEGALDSRAYVVLVEDQAQLRAMVRRTLSRCPCEFEAVASAEEALELIAERRPDLLITDLTMFGMDGGELVQHVRERYPALPVLYVTGYWPGPVPKDSPEDPSFLLLKPFKPRRLRAVVQEILRIYGVSSADRK